MDKNVLGVVTILILAILLIMGWVYEQNGLLAAAIIGIISAICAAVFGYELGIRKK